MTSSVVHGFGERLADGAEGEEFVRKWLSKWGEVGMVVDMETQRLGIDMYLWPSNGSDAMSIEVKTDSMALKTGNAYLETASVVTARGVQKEGWVWTCQADRLVYLVPGKHIAVYAPEHIQDFVNEHWHECMFAKAENDGYWSQGLLVPLDVIATKAMYMEKL